MNVYDYQVTKTNKEVIPLSEYKGKTLLIVNTASKCSFTPQFEDLQKLYDKFKDNGLVILGFPCNQFAEQEPNDGIGATEFCKLNYGVTFPMFSKINVNGKDAHPLFEHLKTESGFKGFNETSMADKILKMMISEKQPEYLVGDAIKWNFTKFLINKNGEVINRFESNVSPFEFEQDIQSIL